MRQLKKSLGQHFLVNASLAGRIVDLLDIRPQDQVLEIGPGAGALTGLIVGKNPARLLLLEKDAHWAEAHQRTFAGQAGEGAARAALAVDALDFEWEGLRGEWKIIGNLPYNVASPLLWEMVSRSRALTQAVFMVQKEVGERLAASPGGRDYGALSVWVQSFADVRRCFTVGPGNFVPPPKVDSAVVRLRALPEAERPRCPRALAACLRMCFQQRRRQMQGILRRSGLAGAMELLARLGVHPAARPETLDKKIFHILAANYQDPLLTSYQRRG
jgi:16S rRNA (adenine1518-N6/adenine1519-N6)-dimethyltransferase